jgi:hypothetical protein
MSSSNIDILVPSLYQLRRNPQHRRLLTVVSATSAPGQASSATLKRPWENFLIQLWTVLCDKHHRKQEAFLYEYPFDWVLLSTKKRCTTERCSLVEHSPSTVTILILKPASGHVHARLIGRLSWSWITLLPSDTYRKPNTSITAVLLLFVTYLLSLPHISILLILMLHSAPCMDT